MSDAPPQPASLPRAQRLEIVPDVAGEFAERVVEAFHYRPDERFSLALCGGPVAAQCYERLAFHAETQIDWWAVEVFWADECLVPPDHVDSHERLARDILLDRVGAAFALHPLRSADAVAAAAAELAARRLDVVHLDLGPDGRLSSLFPGVPATEAFGPTVDPTGLAAHRRYTIGYDAVDQAASVLITAVGAGVREALAAALAGDDVPANRLANPNITWLVDRAAAGRQVESAPIRGSR